MKLLFLGTGSAFTVGDNNYHSNMLLISPTGSKLLIDCGSDVRLSLFEQGFTYADITDVYISHLHADHVGGLEWLALSTKFDPACSRPRLFLPQALHDRLKGSIHTIGLNTLPGEPATLESFFAITIVPINNTFTWDKITFYPVQTVHAMDGLALMPSFGLFFEIYNIKIFITTDTQFSKPQLMPFYERADLIFHDCETSSYHSTVHTHYTDLVELPQEIKKKIWLYHYNPGSRPNAKKDGFLGFVARGQIFILDNQSSGAY